MKTIKDDTKKGAGRSHINPARHPTNINQLKQLNCQNIQIRFIIWFIGYAFVVEDSTTNPSAVKTLSLLIKLALTYKCGHTMQIPYIMNTIHMQEDEVEEEENKCVSEWLNLPHVLIRPTWSPRTHPICEQRRHAVMLLQGGTAIGINL